MALAKNELYLTELHASIWNVIYIERCEKKEEKRFFLWPKTKDKHKTQRRTAKQWIEAITYTHGESSIREAFKELVVFLFKSSPILSILVFENGPLLWQHPHRFICVSHCLVACFVCWCFFFVFGKTGIRFIEIDTTTTEKYFAFCSFFVRFIHAIFHFTFHSIREFNCVLSFSISGSVCTSFLVSLIHWIVCWCQPRKAIISFSSFRVRMCQNIP